MILVLGFLLFGLTHLWHLTLWPGLHYDEAWAALYSARIAHEVGFWPVTAMSPYTMPWSHYWSALWFWLFGTNLFVYRLSQFALVLGGVGLVAATLLRRGEGRRAELFVWILALCPLAIFNHRFAIELTGFHVAMAGLMLYAIQRRWYGIALVSAWLGTTSHILFFGFVLAFLGTAYLFFEWTKRERLWVAVYFWGLLPFLLRVLVLVPEKGKAGALIIFCLLCSGIFLFAFEVLRPTVLRFRRLALFAALPFLANLLVYADGYWLEWVTTGLRPNFPWPGLALVVPLVGALVVQRKNSQDKSGVFFALLTLLFLGAMMLKPAPRYYELALLAAALWMAEVWARIRLRYLVGLFVGLAALATFPLILHMDRVAENGLEREQEMRWSVFRDSSVDFLPKQKLAHFLGLKGCAISGIRGGDPRVLTALQFLGYGDWPVNSSQSCPWSHYRVERQSQLAAKDKPELVFMDFAIFRAE